MESRKLARLVFGDPGLFDFIVHPIVSALTGQPQSTIATISRATEGIRPQGFVSSLAEPLIRTAAQFVPEAQTFVNFADQYTASTEDDAEDDPLGNDGGY